MLQFFKKAHIENLVLTKHTIKTCTPEKNEVYFVETSGAGRWLGMERFPDLARGTQSDTLPLSLTLLDSPAQHPDFVEAVPPLCSRLRGIALKVLRIK